MCRYRTTTFILVGILFFFTARLATGQVDDRLPQLDVAQWPAGVTPRQELPSARSLDYDFDQVDVENIEGWLNWFGVELPVTASGKLSGWLWGQRGTSGWLTFRDYRVEGEIRSPNLRLDRWQIENANLRFGYASGNWYVGRLQGTVRAEQSNHIIGQASLAAKIPTEPSEALETQGSIEQVNLAELLEAFDMDLQLTNGLGQLRFNGNVPFAFAGDLSRWTVDTNLQLDKVALSGFPEGHLDTSAKLENGSWRILQGELDWLAEPIRFEGGGELVDDFPFRLAVHASNISLSHLLDDFGQGELANSVMGDVQITAQTSGTATHGLQNATAELTSEELSVLDQVIRQLLLELSFSDAGLALNLASANVAGGRVTGNSQWQAPLVLIAAPNHLHLQLEQVALDKLSNKILPVSLVGSTTGSVDFSSERTGGSDEIANWQSTGQLEVTDFGAFENQLGTTQLVWNKELHSPELLSRISASDGTLQLDLNTQLSDKPRAPLRHTDLSSYQATGEVKNFATQVNLTAIERELPDFVNALPEDLSKLPLRATGSFHVSGAQENWFESGRFDLAQLDTRLMQRNLGLRSAILLLRPDEFRLQQFQLFDGAGRIAGAAIIRRIPEGNHQLNLRLANIQLEEYATGWVDVPLLSTLRGVADFETRLVNNAANSKWFEGWNGSITASAGDVSLQNMPLGSLEMLGKLDDATLTAEFGGELLDRPATIATRIPRSWLTARTVALQSGDLDQQAGQTEDVESDENDEPIRFDLSWNGVEIARVMKLTRIFPLTPPVRQWLADAELDALQGKVNLETQLQRPATSAGVLAGWQGVLSANMRDVFYRDLDVGNLTVDGKLSNAALSFQLNGNVLNGALTLDAQVPRALLESEPSNETLEASIDEQPEANSTHSKPLIESQQTLRLNMSWTPVPLEHFVALLTDQPLPLWLERPVEQYSLRKLKGVLGLRANVSYARSDFVSHNNVDWTQGWEGALTFNVSDVSLNDQSVGTIVLQAAINDEQFSGMVDGQLLGGNVSGNVQAPTSALQNKLQSKEVVTKESDAVEPLPWPHPAVPRGITKFSASLVGIDLKLLMRIAAGPRNTHSYAGMATLNTDGAVDEAGELRANFDFRVPILWQDRSALARQLVGRFSYDAGVLRVLDLRGGVAGGVVEARGVLPLQLLSSTPSQNVNAREQLQFVARRVEVRELLTFFYPDYATEFSGTLSYRGRVRFQRQIQVVGNVRASRAVAFGLPIQEAHGGLQLQFERDGTFAQLQTSSLAGTWIGGDFTGELQMQGGSTTTLAASGRIGRGKLDQLSRALAFEHVLGTGRFDAAINLQSKDATSIAALRGAVEINFAQGDVQSLPILTELGRYVPLLQLASTDITGGTLHGFISQGQLRIRDFILVGDAFWIVGQGTAGLLSSRLDIEAVLETGGGLTNQLAQSALTRLAVGVVPQAAILAELNNLLSNRSVYFHIGGTTGKPVVQPRPAQIVGKALIQNVRRQLLALPSISLIDEANSDTR